MNEIDTYSNIKEKVKRIGDNWKSRINKKKNPKSYVYITFGLFIIQKIRETFGISLKDYNLKSVVRKLGGLELSQQKRLFNSLCYKHYGPNSTYLTWFDKHECQKQISYYYFETNTEILVFDTDKLETLKKEIKRLRILELIGFFKSFGAFYFIANSLQLDLLLELCTKVYFIKDSVIYKYGEEAKGFYF